MLRDKDVRQTIFITFMSLSKDLYLSFTISSPSEDHQVCAVRLTRSKGRENLAAFSVKEVKRIAAEEREKYSSVEGQ